MPHALAAFAAITLGVPASGVAAPADASCGTYIASTPAVLAEPGVYCLAADLPDPDGYGITIQARDVVLDCLGHSLGRLDNPFGIGVLGHESAVRAHVRDCRVHGYDFGVVLYGGGTVEDNVFRGVSTRAIYVEGERGTIRRNRAIDTGAASVHTTYVISAFGDIDIIDNLVDGASSPNPEGRVIGILANDGLEAGRTFVIRGNVVRDLRPLPGQETYAIYSSSTGALVVRDNVLSGAGAAQDVGLHCPFQPLSHVTGNDIFDFGQPYSGCADDAGNVARP